ncbi:MAG: class I SAM-dependent methyltransferase [Syntrophaceae bacterium]
MAQDCTQKVGNCTGPSAGKHELPVPEWIQKHRTIFSQKKTLIYYYHDVFASLLKEHLLPGATLEIGSGPGFLSDVIADVTTSDVEWAPGIQVVCDAHKLLFPDRQFSNVFFVDVMHHLQAPMKSFCEISRVLRPGGRLVMIEPYTTPLSRIFYKFIHHEACRLPKDAWNNAFPADKEPMAGNAEIPRACLVEQNGPISGDAPACGLRLKKLIPFAGLSYLLTGGFQPWEFPLSLIKALYYLEDKTRPIWAPMAATRCVAVLERV